MHIGRAPFRACEQRWDEMQPVGDGRRTCARCERRLVDFRGLSLDEIAEIHAASEVPLCGAYAPEQITGAPRFNLPRLLTLGVGATLLSSPAAGQTPQRPTSPTPEDSALGRVAAEHAAGDTLIETTVLRVAVRDSATGAGVPNVMVSVEGSPRRTLTDSQGVARIQFSRGGPAAVVLRTAILGYEAERTPVVMRGKSPETQIVLRRSRIEIVGVIPRSVRPPWWKRFLRSIGILSTPAR
jgi:hypothetical protein